MSVKAKKEKSPDDAELLEWAKNIIQEAQETRAWAQVTIHLADGKILRAETRKTYMPAKQANS